MNRHFLMNLALNHFNARRIDIAFLQGKRASKIQALKNLPNFVKWIAKTQYIGWQPPLFSFRMI